MNEEERQEIKFALIELGYWGANEEGDPTTNDRAVGVLLPRIERRLPPGLFLYTDLVGKLMMTHDVRSWEKELTGP